jgi:hypothetical protein
MSKKSTYWIEIADYDLETAKAMLYNRIEPVLLQPKDNQSGFLLTVLKSGIEL